MERWISGNDVVFDQLEGERVTTGALLRGGVPLLSSHRWLFSDLVLVGRKRCLRGHELKVRREGMLMNHMLVHVARRFRAVVLGCVG